MDQHTVKSQDPPTPTPAPAPEDTPLAHLTPAQHAALGDLLREKGVLPGFEQLVAEVHAAAPAWLTESPFDYVPELVPAEGVAA